MLFSLRAASRQQRIENEIYCYKDKRRTVYRVMEEIGISHRPKRKPNGITKANREARKSDDLLKRDFKSDKPLQKAVTDITEIKARDGKLYVSAIFDCFDLAVLGISMDTSEEYRNAIRKNNINRKRQIPGTLNTM